MSIANRRAVLRPGVCRHDRRWWFAVATIATAIGCAREGSIVAFAPSDAALTVRPWCAKGRSTSFTAG